MLSAATSGRLRSVDILRGLACVLMAIDHVRVYSGLPAGGPTAGIFFTRWITHFVAPAFCFLAGTGAYLHGRKLGNPSALTRFLVSRGTLLVVLELTVIRFLWTFNVDYAHYILAGVIWMLGICMILLGVLVRFSPRAVGIFGLIVVFGQQIVGHLAKALPDAVQSTIGWLFQFLYFGGRVSLGSDGPSISVLYSIVPWIGVMAAGYWFGTVFTKEPGERRRLCLRLGLGATVAFLVIGGLLAGRSPVDSDSPPVLFRLLGQQKYPASQLFLLMTLGPLIALVPAAERVTGWLSNALETIGRVPMFYYLLHILVIHLAAMVVSMARFGRVDPWLFGNHPMNPPPQPDGYQWSLSLLYGVFLVVLPALYLGCRWYAGVRARHPRSWLRFI